MIRMRTMERKEFLKQLKQEVYLTESSKSPVNISGDLIKLGWSITTADCSLDLRGSVAKDVLGPQGQVMRWSVKRALDLLPPCLQDYELFYDYPHLYYAKKRMSFQELNKLPGTFSSFYFWEQIEDCARFLFENCAADYRAYLDWVVKTFSDSRRYN